jgi:hypothetical protein
MEDDIEVIGRRRTIVTALPLKRRARALLAERLGDIRVVDIRDAVDVADLVLAPSCSPQTIAALKDAYPSARLVIVEIEDWELDIDLPGPVKRLLAAGADGYLTVDSLDELAVHLGAAPEPVTDATVRALPSPSVDEVIMSALSPRLTEHTQQSR